MGKLWHDVPWHLVRNQDGAVYNRHVASQHYMAFEQFSCICGLAFDI